VYGKTLLKKSSTGKNWHGRLEFIPLSLDGMAKT